MHRCMESELKSIKMEMEYLPHELTMDRTKMKLLEINVVVYILQKEMPRKSMQPSTIMGKSNYCFSATLPPVVHFHK